MNPIQTAIRQASELLKNAYLSAAPQDGDGQNTDTPEGDQADVSQAPDAEPAE